MLAVIMSLRSKRFDKYTLDFLAKHPEGTIINIGCGLDTRFERIDNWSIYTSIHDCQCDIESYFS
jgi:O-methyltransferase involved in polyketide biosynthesis